jgi:hypothetical protein
MIVGIPVMLGLLWPGGPCLAEGPASADAVPATTASSSAAAVTTSSEHSVILEGELLVSKKYHYTLQRPSSDWELQPPETSPIQNPEADAELTCRNGGFAIVVAEKAAVTPRALVTLAEDRLRNVMKDFKEIRREDTTVGGLEACIVELTGTVDDARLHYLGGYIAGERQAYQVMCWAPQPLYEDNAKEFEALVRSFRELPQASKGAGAAPAQPGVILEGLSLTSKPLGVSLTLPSPEWGLSADPKAEGDTELDLESRNGGYALVGGERTTMNVEATAKLFLAAVQGKTTGYQEVSRRKLKVGPLDALQVVATTVQEETPIRYVVTFTCGLEHCYYLACWSSESLFTANEKEFETLIASFREQSR